MIEHTKCCRKNEWQFQVAHGKDIEKACQSIYLLHDVFVRKVEMLKKPKFELGNSWSFMVKVAALQQLKLNKLMDRSPQVLESVQNSDLMVTNKKSYL